MIGRLSGLLLEKQVMSASCMEAEVLEPEILRKEIIENAIEKYKGQASMLYQQQPDGRFIDVTKEYNLFYPDSK